MAIVRVFHVRLEAQSVRMAMRVAETVLVEMQLDAAANAAGGVYSRGRLADSIYRSGPMSAGSNVIGSVGSRLPYAASVEGGASVHAIFPKGMVGMYRWGRKRRPMLKFLWRGQIVYFNQIPGARSTLGRSHPGQRGKNYLTNALVGAAVRNGLRVVVYDI